MGKKKVKSGKYGDLFKAVRSVHGLKQAEFAERLGTSQSMMSKIESGDLDPPLAVFQKLYQRFGGQDVKNALLGD